MHISDSIGAQCAACHMPTRNYMLIDPRHDHSIRIPRPDLSSRLQTPNACTGCHKDRSASWAAAAIERSFGPDRKGFQTFGAALHDGRIGAPEAIEGLMALVTDSQIPAIARATALAELRPYLKSAVVPALEAGLADPDPMVRGAALDTLLDAPPQERLRLGFRVIDDASPIVRIKAARVLAVMPAQGGDAEMLARLDKAFAEYVASQRANADRPEAHLNLGLFYAERQDSLQAESEYRAALNLQSDFVPAYVNLADLYRAYNRDSDAEEVLISGLRISPGNADLQYALGLLRVRQKRLAEALPLLDAAARMQPNNVRYAYVYGIALHDSGRTTQGILVLERELRRFPFSPDLLSALGAYARDEGDAKRAATYLKRLALVSGPAPESNH
jgi:tetratricopeptide (TPR) repeat protein